MTVRLHVARTLQARSRPTPRINRPVPNLRDGPDRPFAACHNFAAPRLDTSFGVQYDLCPQPAGLVNYGK